jgi:hypothetical protein
MVVFAAPFAACGGGSVGASSGIDAGPDVVVEDGGTATDGFAFDAPVIGDAIVRQCSLNDADPVGLCVQQAALSDLHQHAFAAMKGAAASWNSTTLAPDTNEAGTVSYSLDDTVGYAAAAVDYLASAELYGDTSINALLQADLQAIAFQLETSFSPSATEYSGELYFHLRTVAAGLRKLDLNPDGDKFDTLANTYGRAIAAHFVALGSVVVIPDAGKGDATVHDAGDGGGMDAGGGDAGHVDAGTDAARDTGAGAMDAGTSDASVVVTDGIIGNASGNQVAYATADVATAAYALLDMVNENPKDASIPIWLAEARASLVHLQLRAKEPTTGMFYANLVSTRTDGGTVDTPAPGTTPGLPSDALLADTQATFALAMVRAQGLVTSNTVAHLTGLDGGDGSIGDGGVTGLFVPVLDIPFEAWADATMKAMNGTPSLWDGTTVDGGGTPTNGYMDGYVVSTGTLITTKSTRTNALMAGAIALAYTNGADLTFYSQRQTLVQLLIAVQSFTIPLNSNLITILPLQVAYLRGGTRQFQPLDAGPNPLSYTSAAVSAAVEGLNDQLPASQ